MRTPECDNEKCDGAWVTPLPDDDGAERGYVYPCRTCNPVMFRRWTGGHLGNDHDQSACGECIEANGGRRGRKRSRAFEPSGPPSAGYAPEPRRDTGSF